MVFAVEVLTLHDEVSLGRALVRHLAGENQPLGAPRLLLAPSTPELPRRHLPVHHLLQLRPSTESHGQLNTTHIRAQIGALENEAKTFENVADCLYRPSTNGVYYARFESHGKKIRRSQRCSDGKYLPASSSRGTPSTAFG